MHLMQHFFSTFHPQSGVKGQDIRPHLWNTWSVRDSLYMWTYVWTSVRDSFHMTLRHTYSTCGIRPHMRNESRTLVHTCGIRPHMWNESRTLVHTYVHMYNESRTLVHTCGIRPHMWNESRTLVHTYVHMYNESRTLHSTPRVVAQTHAPHPHPHRRHSLPFEQIVVLNPGTSHRRLLHPE